MLINCRATAPAGDAQILSEVQQILERRGALTRAPVTLAVSDSWRDSAAAAVIVQVKALLTDAMRAQRPDRRFPGFTHVDDLADTLVRLWETPAAESNGTRLCPNQP